MGRGEDSPRIPFHAYRDTCFPANHSTRRKENNEPICMGNLSTDTPAFRAPSLTGLCRGTTPRTLGNPTQLYRGSRQAVYRDPGGAGCTHTDAAEMRTTGPGQMYQLLYWRAAGERGLPGAHVPGHINLLRRPIRTRLYLLL